MSDTMIICILAIYFIALVGLAWNNRRLSKIARDAVNMAGDVVENADALIDMTVAWQKRDKEVAKLFSGILFDLTHATDKNVLQWKLSMLKNIGFLMGLTGYENVYDDDFYTWMINTLTKLPKNAQVAQLEKIRDAVKGYYIMDVDVGKNFCDMIANIISMNDDMAAAMETYRRTYVALINAIKSTDIEFLIADMDRHATNKTPRERLFDSLAIMRQTCEEAERVVQEFMKECESKDESAEPVESDKGENLEKNKVPEEEAPVVQGEAVEESTEIDPTAGPKVSVVELNDSVMVSSGVEVSAGKKHV